MVGTSSFPYATGQGETDPAASPPLTSLRSPYDLSKAMAEQFLGRISWPPWGVGFESLWFWRLKSLNQEWAEYIVMYRELCLRDMFFLHPQINIKKENRSEAHQFRLSKLSCCSSVLFRQLPFFVLLYTPPPAPPTLSGEHQRASPTYI